MNSTSEDSQMFATMRPVVLAKGFGNGGKTKEFRMILPSEPVGEIAARLADLAPTWARLLQPLYDRTAEDLSRQYAILVSESEIGAFVVAPSRDAFRRRSLVVIGLIARRVLDVRQDAVIGRQALARVRTGIQGVSEIVSGDSRSAVAAAMDLVAQREAPELSDPPPALFYSVLLKSQEFNGAATLLLLGLGADVVVGTQHEAATAARQGAETKATFDVRTQMLYAHGVAVPAPDIDGDAGPATSADADATTAETVAPIASAKGSQPGEDSNRQIKPTSGRHTSDSDDAGTRELQAQVRQLQDEVAELRKTVALVYGRQGRMLEGLRNKRSKRWWRSLWEEIRKQAGV